MLTHIEELEDDIEALCARIEEEIRPNEPALSFCARSPAWSAARPSDHRRDRHRHVGVPDSRASGFLGRLCPGQNESAGKRKSAKTRKGSKWLRKTLTESARAAARTRESYLAERYRRLAARRGDKKAIVAISHELLTVAHHMLQTGELYREQGADTLRKRDQTASAAARSANSRSSDTRSSSKSFQRPHNDQRLSHLSGYFLTVRERAAQDSSQVSASGTLAQSSLAPAV